MGNWGRHLALGALVVVETAGSPYAATSEPVVLVKLIDEAPGLRSSTVKNACGMAASIFRQAGIALQWVDTPGEESGQLVLMLTLRPDGRVQGLRFAQDAMGTARSGEDGPRGTDAYVFADRVIAFTEAGHLDPWVVLGFVMAHELGHLLLPVNAHTRDGIMRGAWEPQSLPKTGAGGLGFSAEQARLMRLRLTTRTP
jgi:hypothetical protein